MSNGTDQAQPQPENTAQFVDSRPRKRASPAGDNWLPPGWTTEEKVRTSGSKAGAVDKFYYEPVTGRKFRSKNEVLHYVEHGTPKKSAKKAENGDIPSVHSEGQGSSKRRNKSTQKANERSPSPPLNFDFQNVPDHVTWHCPANLEEPWSATIGDYKVPESVRQEWERAFFYVMKHGKSTL